MWGYSPFQVGVVETTEMMRKYWWDYPFGVELPRLVEPRIGVPASSPIGHCHRNHRCHCRRHCPEAEDGLMRMLPPSTSFHRHNDVPPPRQPWHSVEHAPHFPMPSARRRSYLAMLCRGCELSRRPPPHWHWRRLGQYGETMVG